MGEQDVMDEMAPATSDLATRQSPARILLVDDDAHNLVAMRSILDDLAEVVAVTSGEEALRELLKGDFAVVLLDVIMPGMDGYETAALIRGREQTRRTPIVFLSAVNTERPHLLRGYASGAVDYVFKPVEPFVLRSKVAVFVDLFDMAREIEEKAKREQRLLEANLQANAERMAAERELWMAEQRLTGIISVLPIVLYVEPPIETGRRLDLIAGDVPAVTGFEGEAAELSEDWSARVHSEDLPRVAAALSRRDEAGEFSIEYRWRSASGAYRHLLDQAVRIEESDGAEAFYAGTLLDISDRKMLETELLHARKLDAIGKLSGGIAHDFNNLLATVLGGIRLIEQRLPLDEEQRKITELATRAARRGEELVKRLLAFSRRQDLEPSSIDLRTLCESVNDLLAHTLGGLVQLEWSVGEDVGPAHADEAQLELAVMNLIINARDAMPDGGRIVISARNATVKTSEEQGRAAGDYVVLTIADEGCGMSEEVLQKATEPYFTTKAVGKGTGLGLSMVYGFARQSGGVIDIDSRVGEGTSVHVWLPRASTRAPDASRDEDLPATAPRPLRVLLVDDHEGVRCVVAGLLRELGHTVTDLASAAEALDRLRKAPADYDIVVSDYAMPLQSGVDAIEAARRVRSDIASVIISGHADAVAHASRPDRAIVLAKPFSPAKLASAMEEAVRMVETEASPQR